MKIFACQNTNESELLQSSSGGIFILLAKMVLNKGGCVYGACFDKDFNVSHIRVDSVIDIHKLLGSKYVYSNLGGIFKTIKEDIENKKFVLFVGTPCQTTALRKFIGTTNNLLLVDFICHGTPNNVYWQKYIEEIKYNRDIVSVNFRDKCSGWKDYSFTVKYSNGDVDIENHLDNIYMKGFLYNLTLRESCFNCKFKDINNKASDLTLGDYWGGESSSIFNNNGTSIVIINSDIGERYFEYISSDLIKEKVDYNFIVAHNSSLSSVAKKNYYYNQFKRDFNKSNNLIKTLHKYTDSKLRLLINRIYWKCF